MSPKTSEGHKMSPKLSVLVTRFCNPCSRRAVLFLPAESIPSHTVLSLPVFSHGSVFSSWSRLLRPLLPQKICPVPVLKKASSASEAAQDSAASHVRRGLLLKPLPSPRQTALCLLRFLRSLQTDRRFLKRRFVRAPPAILCRSCDRRSSAQPASRF